MRGRNAANAPNPAGSVNPFLKWAGGKRWLATSSDLELPKSYARYIEPFLGSGAIFFRLQPASALLSDLNAELIELYTVVRDDPKGLLCALEVHHKKHDKDYYYSIRASRPDTCLGRAARTLYLNRTCWNGLYRVNLRGEFNVPIGTKTQVLFDGETFENASEALCRAEIRCSDFQDVLEEASEGDFVFVDPPYTVQHNLNGFLKYNEHIFSWTDQIRLCDAVKAASARGAAILITNADHESVRALYRGVCDYRPVSRASVLAGKAQHRGKTTEALFAVNMP